MNHSSLELSFIGYRKHFFRDKPYYISVDHQRVTMSEVNGPIKLVYQS